MGICDFHSHIIPAVDDGAANVEDVRRALNHMQEQGVTRIIASPHFDGELTLVREVADRRLSIIDIGWKTLEDIVRNEFPTLEIYRGAEVMLNVPRPDITDPRLRLAGTRFVLIEFPGMSVPPNSACAIAALRKQGVTPVIAHPERYYGITGMLDLVKNWIEAGAFLQVNHGSLLGYYGNAPRLAAFMILENSLASYLSSDYHARGDSAILASRSLFQKLNALPAFKILTQTNPMRLSENELPQSVPAVSTPVTLWQTIRERLGM